MADDEEKKVESPKPPETTKLKTKWLTDSVDKVSEKRILREDDKD